MVISNTTTEAINYAKDIDIEYNIKIILLGMLFLYSVILIYLSYKWELNELWVILMKWLIMRIPSIIFLFFSPFFTIFLFRSASWELIYSLMISYFSYIMIVLMIVGNFGMFTFFANLLGINTGVKKMELNAK